jgi:hypothetical protein
LHFLDYDSYCLPSAKDAVKFFQSAATDKVGQYLFDLYTARQVLGMAVGISIVLTILFMVILRCCAKTLMWITLFAFAILLAVLGYYFYKEYQSAADPGDALNYKIIAIILWCLDGAFLLGIWCMYDDIQLALAIIEAAAAFIFQTFTIIIFPFYAIALTVAFMIYWIYTVLYIYSIGTISQYGTTPLASVAWDDSTRYLWYYHLFGLFWVLAFLLAWVQFVVAACAAQWYFSSSSDTAGKGSVCKSTYWSVRYHMGSLAFGSLILAIVMFVRFIFEYMKAKFEEGPGKNRLTQCLLAIASCCLRCIGQCVLFLTKNAYIQVIF